MQDFATIRLVARWLNKNDSNDMYSTADNDNSNDADINKETTPVDNYTNSKNDQNSREKRKKKEEKT